MLLALLLVVLLMAGIVGVAVVVLPLTWSWLLLWASVNRVVGVASRCVVCCVLWCVLCVVVVIVGVVAVVVVGGVVVVVWCVWCCVVLSVVCVCAWVLCCG